MRIVSLLLIFLSSSVVCAQEGEKGDQQQEQQKMPAALDAYPVLKRMRSNIPPTLAEAHVELERMLSPETLAEIDAMPSEDGMVRYHFSLGLNIRNGWGLWAGGPLAKHMEKLGFTHADDMSGVILKTFWCKRHGKAFRLEERAAYYKKYWEAAQEAQEEEESRVQKSNAAIRDMMMGLRFEKRDAPIVQIPTQTGMNVRFMWPFRGGVFITACCQWPLRPGPIVTAGHDHDPVSGEPRRRTDMDDSVMRGLYLGADPEFRRTELGDNFYTQGFYLDLKERKTQRIRVEEVNEVYAAAVAGERAWFAGLTKGKAVLAGVGDTDHITVPLPQGDEIPDLGIDGQSLLAVYSKTIYRLRDRSWTLVHSGDILLPRSGLPPQRHGHMVFFRDEGMIARRGNKRLWWLAMGEKSHLRLLARDTGLFDPIVRRSGHSERVYHIGPPGWDEASSYCVTSSGDLWACVADGSFLLRRSKDGNYSIAIAYNSVQFTGDPRDKKDADQDLSVSAVTVLPDDTLLLIGDTALYRLKGNELVQDLAFAIVPQSRWTPSSVLMLDDHLYVIGSTMLGGVYLLRMGDDGQWNCLPADNSRDTVIW